MSARRKILCLDTNLEVGGVVTVLLGFLGRLDRAHFDVHVAHEVGGVPAEQLAKLDSTTLIPCRFGTKSGRAGASLRGRLLDALSLPLALFTILKLAVYVRLRGVELIHTSDKIRSVFVALGVSLLSGRPLVYHVHCVCVDNKLNRFALKRATAILANSHAMKADFIAKLGSDMERIQVVHNGVDTRVSASGPDLRAECEIPRNAVVIGAASRLAPNKGQADLLRAFAHIAERAPGAWLILAGDDSIEDGNANHRAELEALARELGIDQRTRFLGFRSDMDAVYRTTDIVVDAAWEEPFGMVVVEPMVYGRPVVGTNAGGIPEIIDDGSNGVLVPPRDPEALGDALLRLVVDTGWRAALGRGARESVVQRFELDVHTAQVAAVFEHVANGDAPTLSGARSGGASKNTAAPAVSPNESRGAAR
ncbi:MAG: hypothetical protein DHS20C15_15060 [Planctomycetota bacterium]|nr:MAG: hypothetical protein DHS20C15_15060 [Planctomycetota bacterium]